MPYKYINIPICSLILCAFLTFFLWSELCFSGQASDLVDRSPNSYLKGRNINTELLNFDNVQSYCFICWGEGDNDPNTGRQSHDIVYINDLNFKVRTKLNSIRNDESIIFQINFKKLANEQIINHKIKLPDDRVSFYSNLLSKNNEGSQNKLNVMSGNIEFKSLAGNCDTKTVGNFTVYLRNNVIVEGGFSVRPRIREYGP